MITIGEVNDLRDFMALLDQEGDLRRVKAEVDWDLELCHVAKRNEEKNGPALLFEKVKGYQTPVITSLLSST
ncbi:MAG: UbiD family decarboxylase, partial [Chloroflexi bacterium]|nr:UbiD family decarboxylase [Chloroflexota bacterium]